MTERFEGFPPQAFSFFKELYANNRRDWFEGHRQDYSDFILAPARAFTAGLGERLKLISSGIEYDTQTNGRGSIERLHRDVRFSKDKSPYKTHLGIVFWEKGKAAKKTEGPGFYFRMDADGGAVFAGMHEFPRPLLQRYRDAVVDDDLGGELHRAVARVTGEGGCQVGGEHYKRMPSGYERNHPRAGLLRYSGLFASSPILDSKSLSNAGSLDTCFGHCRAMAPVYDWLLRALYG